MQMSRVHSHLRTASLITHILENQFKVGRYRFGLDPILGLIPGGGDALSLLISFYIVWIGIKMQIPGEKIAQMMGNVAFDFLIGIIPFLGDLADVAFKANSRNLEILKEFAPEEVFEAKPVKE